MSAAPPHNFSISKVRIQRAARRLLWRSPSVYFPFGILRKRGNVLRTNLRLYIDGYPRSGNTFARTAFLSANPAAQVHSHRHIPSFVLRAVRREVPGILLIRNPLDAAVSWAIHENQTLEEAIVYWNDYYETLLPVRTELFLADFKEITTDFGAVIKAFNRMWRTSYAPFDHTPENAARCFRVTEEEHRASDGNIREMQVCRPSLQRGIVKETHLLQLDESLFLRDELARARDIYDTFLRDRVRRRKVVIPPATNTPWQRYWGEPYGLSLKQWLLKPVFEKLEHEGKAGDIIVDVGSGAQPVTAFLPHKPGRKRVLIDVAAENAGTRHEQRIRLDVEKVAHPTALSLRKALVRVCKFLEIAPGSETKGADTVVFSDLLNYVDFRGVLHGFARYLKPGGRFVIVNLPIRGNQSLFSDKGLKDNRHLLGFLAGHQFEIEHKAFPCRPRDETDESEELIVLVARKCA